MDKGTVSLSDFDGFEAADEAGRGESDGFEKVSAGADTADAGEVWPEGSAEVAGLVAKGAGGGGALEDDPAPLGVTGRQRFFEFVEPGALGGRIRGEGLASGRKIIPDRSGRRGEAFVEGGSRQRGEGSGIAQSMKESHGVAFVRNSGEGLEEDWTEQKRGPWNFRKEAVALRGGEPGGGKRAGGVLSHARGIGERLEEEGEGFVAEDGRAAGCEERESDRCGAVGIICGGGDGWLEGGGCPAGKESGGAFRSCRGRVEQGQHGGRKGLREFLFRRNRRLHGREEGKLPCGGFRHAEPAGECRGTARCLDDGIDCRAEGFPEFSADNLGFEPWAGCVAP